jgi:transposase
LLVSRALNFAITRHRHRRQPGHRPGDCRRSIVGLDTSIVNVAAKLSPCIIAMEACCGAHHLGRILAAQGHTVRLISPEYVRPYVKAQKNDNRDAEAIAEAATRPTIRFVALKSEEQLDMQSLHRARDRVVVESTSLMNQLRALLCLYRKPYPH